MPSGIASALEQTAREYTYQPYDFATEAALRARLYTNLRRSVSAPEPTAAADAPVGVYPDGAPARRIFELRCGAEGGDEPSITISSADSDGRIEAAVVQIVWVAEGAAAAAGVDGWSVAERRLERTLERVETIDRLSEAYVVLVSESDRAAFAPPSTPDGSPARADGSGRFVSRAREIGVNVLYASPGEWTWMYRSSGDVESE